MFEVGFTEIILIFCLALVVLGPEKLPRVAAQIGRWIGRARAMARQFRDQLETEVDLEAHLNPKPRHDGAQRASTSTRPPPSAASSTPDSSVDSSSGMTGEPSEAQASTAPAQNFVPSDDDTAHRELQPDPDFQPPAPGGQDPPPHLAARAAANDPQPEPERDVRGV